MKQVRKFWLALVLMLLLSPLGLILPAHFNAGVPWGEWKTDEIAQKEGYVPAGMARSAERWEAPLPGYSFKGQEDAPPHAMGFSYIVSGIAGAGLVVILILLIGRLWIRNEDTGNS